MTWNYRVMKFDPETPEDEPYYGIVEVYYTDEGGLKCHTENAIRFTWDEGDSGTKMLHQMSKAFALPVLTPKDFGG